MDAEVAALRAALYGTTGFNVAQRLASSNVAKADLGDAELKLGQTATVLLELPKATGAIRLPLAAVAEAQGKSVVWLLDKATMTVRPQAIEVGGADGNNVLVAAGLSPGQSVVTAGVHMLTPGQKVKLYVEPAAHPAQASAASR